MAIDEAAEQPSTHVLGSDNAEPTAQDIERAEQAQKELAARGIEVWTKKLWWGFEIHLNAEAADKTADIAELIGDIAGEILPSPFNKIVETFCKVKAAWIKAVSDGYGCKLVSPWIAPGMLIPVSTKPKDDSALWWTVLGTSGPWGDDQRLHSHRTAASPALAEFRGKLVCVHRGNSDSRLWWAVYDPDNSWSDDRQLPNHATASGPALATFKNTLYCVHRGDRDNSLWVTSTSDGVNWSRDTELPDHKTSSGPALAVFKDRLYCVHRGNSGNNSLWVTSTGDGVNWTRDTELSRHKTDSNPALAVHGGYLRPQGQRRQQHVVDPHQ